MHWKLSGLDQLGEDFTVAADSGIVEPKSEYALNAYFRAMKPVTTSKKTIRLEVGIYGICDISEQSHDGITVMCISIGTPKNNKFSICPKWKIYYSKCPKI